MRLLSITVRSYRIHEDLTVELDPSRTVIAGPNESGKSTLAEAAHRALFLKAKVGGEAQKSMVSDIFPGHPEVEVRFETADGIYRIAKRFSGNSGTATLTREGGGTWSQDEAESKLAELLRVEVPGGGRGAADRAAQQWAHLWVRQGESGADPSGQADSQRDSLLARLQETGGAAVMESELDVRAASRFGAAVEDLFTKAGKPKAHSDLDRANEAVLAAEEKLEAARQAHRQLAQAAGDFTDSGRIIGEKNSELETLSRSKLETEQKLEKVRVLRHRAELEERDVEQAARAHDTFAGTDREIADLGETIRELAKNLEPGTARTAGLEAEVAQRKDAHRRLTEEARTQDEKLRATRARVQLALSWKERFECQDRLDRLSAIAGEIKALKDAGQALDSQLAQLPAITAEALKSLHDLSRAHAEAGIALEAMAAGITVRASDLPVAVAGEVLVEGETRILAEDTEVTIGDTTRLLITPGGGTRLADARRQVEATRASLESAYDELGVKTVDEATQIREKRLEIESRLSANRAELKARGADRIDGELAAATLALESAAAEAGRRRKAVTGDVSEPADLEAAAAMALSLQSGLDTLESEETGVRARIDASGKKLGEAEEALDRHRQGLKQSADELKAAEIRLATHEETHGDASARKKRLESLSQARQAAEVKLAGTREALETLQADTLEADLARFSRAIGQAHAEIRAAEQRRAVAGNLLTRDGTTDPAETLALAEAEVESTRNRQLNVGRKAEATRLLAELFAAQRRSLADRFTQPLAGKITGYLQQLFGPGACAEITLTEGSFERPVLIRGGSAFDFAKLSGGAREQVAAAFRLAMAEILAQDHGGCLPLVFDDAFTHSDSDRVRTLQRMLDLAARRGLQVILLTCHPADYTGLGARTVMLGGGVADT